MLAYGLAFLFFLVLFLSAPAAARGAPPCRLLAMAGMAFALLVGDVLAGGGNIYFPAFPRSVHSICICWRCSFSCCWAPASA